ncbi:MAG: hypothetical protein LBT04_07440 [Prevotellaceae bacterium]|nr:hypothetical protein [Prevotellaceae bacterium]
MLGHNKQVGKKIHWIFISIEILAYCCVAPTVVYYATNLTKINRCIFVRRAKFNDFHPDSFHCLIIFITFVKIYQSKVVTGRTKYKQRIIRAIALVMCVLYVFGNLSVTVAHPLLHHHIDSIVSVCHCANNAPHHFHQSAEKHHFHEHCYFCQNALFLALIDNKSIDYQLFYVNNKINFNFLSKKYSTDFSTSSPRAPPLFS